MFCPKCGFQNADDAAFCGHCGYNLGSHASTAQSASGTIPPVNGNPSAFQPPINAEPVRSSHPVLNALKNLGASPLYIVATSAYTLSLLLSLFVAIFSRASLMGSIFHLADELGLDSYYLYNVLPTIKAGSVIGSIFGMIPAILYAVGMWMLFASAIDRSNGGMKTGGLTLIKVLNIINLVLTSIACGLLILLMLIGVFASSYAGGNYGLAAGTVLIVMIVVILVIAAFVIPYYVLINKTINHMKNAITTGQITGLASGYVAVISIISGVLSFFSIFGLFGSGFAVALQGVSSGVASFCFGIFLFKYNGRMRALQQQLLYQASAPMATTTSAPQPFMNDGNGSNPQQ